MQTNDDRLAFSLKSLVRHSPAVLATGDQIRNRSSQLNDTDGDTIGGVIRNGTFGYLATGPTIEVVSLKTGARVSSCNFESVLMSPTNITCVAEVELVDINTCVLAIGLQSDKHGGVVCLFAVQGARVLRTMEIVHKITSCCFVGGPAICARSDLALFDGCLAVGTDIGRVILIDLALKNVRDVLMGRNTMKSSADCLICMASVSYDGIKRQHKQSKTEDINFGIQLEALEHSGPVLSILSLQPLLSLAVGLSDGRLVLYTMCGLEAFHLAHPPERDSPLIKMAFIEPADDPRACVYLWAFHTNADAAVAVMHSIMYQTKVSAPNGSAHPDHIYDDFQSCSSRLTMPIFDRESFPVGCQTISKQLAEDEDKLSLCVLAWTRHGGSSSQVCVFDLNQWYKEQMPSSCDWRQSNSYLALFPLEGLSALDLWMDSASVTPFSSIQRPEEHFWPISLNFECIGITTAESCRLHWPGLQNKSLELLCRSGPQAILEPQRCFAAMNHATLLPQFIDYNPHAQQSLRTKQEFLLSIALEYNCVSLLRDCARAWADGSHIGAQPQQGLSLSTLTDWIWARAGATKETCNQMCVSLFDHSGVKMDLRTQNRLLHCARQLKTLADLMNMILSTCDRFIPNEVMANLESQRNSIRMAHEYQEVLQWLLNMGLLPEGSPASSSRSFDTATTVPYPYRALRQFYATQRQKFVTIDPQLLNTKRSCRILYIDTFIERLCEPACLRAEWRKGAGDGLYPPPSLQAMLRTLLVPGVDVELKYTLFVYLFLDLSVALDEERFAGVVQRLIKFPAVFKMNPALIKTTQAFWNLDHGQFETAIEELISPLSQERHLTQWQQEILIESLLVQESPHLALRALRAPGPPIAPLLEIRTLLANNLVAEAFQLQRSKADKSLLFEFFKKCHEQQKWHFVLDLSLNAAEEECLGTFLRTADSSLTTNLHFLYLLQRTKYIEAISFVDNMQHNRTTAGRRRRANLDTPNTIVAAYKLTMTPTTRTMSDIYYSLKDNINMKLNEKASNPNPLSTKLLQRKLDLVGGVYHRTVLSAEQTTPTYWLNQPKKQCNLSANNIPFLRNPQYDMMELAQRKHMHHNTGLSHATAYLGNQKRNHHESELDVETIQDKEKAEGPKKRRRIDPTADHFPIITTREPKPFQMVMDTTLTTPIVESAQDRTPPKSFAIDRVQTPLSILKTKSIPGSPARSVRIRSVSPSSSDSDENFSPFNMPSDVAEGFRSATPIATSTILIASKSAQRSSLNKNSTTVSGNESFAEYYFSPEVSKLEMEQGDDVNQAAGVYREQEVNEIANVVEVESNDDDDVEEVDEFPENDLQEKSNQVVTPPDNSIKAKQLLYSEQESPQQRRVVLEEGIKARKRLHVEGSEDLSTETNSSDVDTSTRNQSQIREAPPMLRRSSRSRSNTPDIEIQANTSTPDKQEATQHKTVTPVHSKPFNLQRKPLSRLVLESNAMKAGSSTTITHTMTMSSTSISADVSSFLSDASNASTSAAAALSNVSAFDETTELSESFMDRWNAERRAIHSSANSTLNETPMFGSGPMFSDSDASFMDTDVQPNHPTMNTEVQPTDPTQEVICVAEESNEEFNVEEANDDEESVQSHASNGSLQLADESEDDDDFDDDESAGDTDRSSELLDLGDDSDQSNESDNNSVSTDSDSSFTADPRQFSRPVTITEDVINISSSDEDVVADTDPVEDVDVDDNEIIIESEFFNVDNPDEADYVVDTTANVCQEQVNTDALYANQEAPSTDVSWQELKTAECSMVGNTDDAQVFGFPGPSTEDAIPDLEAAVPEYAATVDAMDASWQEMRTAESSTTENLDNALPMETPNSSSQFEECDSADVSELNHAIIRDTEEVNDETTVTVVDDTHGLVDCVEEVENVLDQGGILSIIDDTVVTEANTNEVVADNYSLILSVNEEVNELDQGYLLEDTSKNSEANSSKDVVQAMEEDVDEAMEMAPLVAESTEEDIITTPEEVIGPQNDVEECEEALELSPLIVDATQPTPTEDVVSEIIPEVARRQPEDFTKALKRDHIETTEPTEQINIHQSTPEKLIKLSLTEAQGSIPTTSGIVLRLRSRSISTEDKPPEGKASPVSTPSRRSLRAKSVSKMNEVLAPETPVSTRKLRGASEPRHLNTLETPKKTSVRRLLDESKAQTPVDADNLTPIRRSTRRKSQSSIIEEEPVPSSGTPVRRSRRASQNISPIAEGVAMLDTPKRRSKRTQDDNDDSASVVSHGSRTSEVSTRTTRSRAQSNAAVDDDSVSVKSEKSSRSTASKTASKKGSARSKVLPAIDEKKESEEVEHNESPETSVNYSDSRRLTRHQIGIMERMKKVSDAHARAATPKKAITPSGQAVDSESEDDATKGSSPGDTHSKSSGRSSRRAAKVKNSDSPAESATHEQGDGETPTSSDASRPRRRTRKTSTSSSKQ